MIALLDLSNYLFSDKSINAKNYHIISHVIYVIIINLYIKSGLVRNKRVLGS